MWAWHRFGGWRRNWLDFIVGSRTWHNFSVGIRIDFVLVRGSKWLPFCPWVEIYMVLVWGSKLACFLCGDRNWLGLLCGGGWWRLAFCVRVDNDCFFSLDRNTSLNLAWFQFRDQNWFGLCLGGENDVVLEYGSVWTWILCDVRPQIDVESFDRWRFGLQIPVMADWVPQMFIC